MGYRILSITLKNKKFLEIRYHYLQNLNLINNHHNVSEVGKD